MTKADFVQEVARVVECSRREAATIVETVFASVVKRVPGRLLQKYTLRDVKGGCLKGSWCQDLFEKSNGMSRLQENQVPSSLYNKGENHDSQMAWGLLAQALHKSFYLKHLPVATGSLAYKITRICLVP